MKVTQNKQSPNENKVYHEKYLQSLDALQKTRVTRIPNSIKTSPLLPDIHEIRVTKEPVVPERRAAAPPALLPGGARGAVLPFAFQYNSKYEANAC